MTIRFSCDCGAEFEVPADRGGLMGRCGRCGKQIPIPLASAPAPPVADEIADSPKEASPEGHPETFPHQFCPFCGTPTESGIVPCPDCARKMAGARLRREKSYGLTTADWILVTVLAPLGFLGGVVNMVMGNSKGLNMMGIATATIFGVWLAAVALGWLG